MGDESYYSENFYNCVLVIFRIPLCAFGERLGAAPNLNMLRPLPADLLLSSASRDLDLDVTGDSRILLSQAFKTAAPVRKTKHTDGTQHTYYSVVPNLAVPVTD